ncbi:MAG: AMP-binding protein [Candidatus Brocadiia bacterium]
MDSDGIQTIADILPRRAETTPGRTALLELGPDDGLRRTSYGELKRRVGAHAAYLHAEGVRPGQRVAVVMPNSSRWIADYYSIFRLGAVAVPLEYGVLESDPARIHYALEHSEASAVLCEPGDEEAVSRLTSARVLTGAEESGGEPPPQPPVAPSDLAQILYTSGTTGPKKGVELTHRNVIFDVDRSCRRFGVTPDDRLPAMLPYHHAYPLTTTVVLPLYAGASLAVGDIRDRRSRILLRESRPTVVVGVPRVFESIMDSIRSTANRTGRLGRFEAACRLARLVKQWTNLNLGRVLFRGLHVRLFGGQQLRFCVSGGARVSPDLLRQFFVLGIPVVQGWGMSEISPVGAVQDFSTARFYFTRHYERKAGSIGRPLDDTDISFTQSSVEELSFDLEHWGEMVVSGPHVMRGYHKDPEGTERQMLDGGVRTGDIARRDHEGDLYIVGRVKHVIVLANGKKVFPEEDLEEPLSECETIEEFAVRPITDQSGSERIGIIVRPALEQVREAETMGELYRLIKRDIDEALARGPGYLRHYSFCLTKWTGSEFEELVKTGMGDPSPLRNEFVRERSHAAMRDSKEPTPWERD